MQLDLNDYFPSCNLPRLYRERAKAGDDERARSAATVARMACERSKALGSADVWLRPTLLGMAFDAADVPTAERLYDEIVEEGPAAWQLETTLVDLKRSVCQVKDPAVKIELGTILQRLAALIA